MLELFDMGKYNFFVWSSIALFIMMIAVDLGSVWQQRKQITRRIKARHRRKQS